MLHLWNIQWLLLYFLIGQLHVQYTRATWPLSNTSNIQLLGLFPSVQDDSDYETMALSVYTSAMFKAALILSQKLNITIEGQFIGWQAVETDSDEIGALSSTCRALTTSNIIGIVGPVFSRQASVIADLTETIGIPTISYSATDPDLSNKNAFPTFYRTIPSDGSAALAIVDLFIQYNWTSCIIIYQNDEFGTGGVDALSEEFDNNNLTVDVTLLFDISTLAFRGDLKTTLLSSSTRIVISWADLTYTPLILQHALDNDVLGPQFLWILGSDLSFDAFNQTFYEQLIGIITIEATVGNAVNASINTTLLNAAYTIWQQYEPETFPGSTQITNYALFAFDATWTLIQSLEKLCSTDINNSSSCLSFIESSFCFDCRFLNADSLFNTISTTDFLGVSGPIQFSNSTTHRVNGIYYIARNIQSYGNGLNYVSVLQLTNSGNWEVPTQGGVIVWPGQSLTPPTGLPSLTGVNLRIGVIAIAPFTMVTQVIDASGKNTTQLIGYAQDLITVLQNMLGFTAEIILIPSNQSSDQAVQAVANNVYDMVLSDLTITAERRDIVDFSISIFDNSLSIIVRQTSNVQIDILAFMKPFSPGLWLVILGTLFYSSILICIIERRGNDALKDRSILSLIGMSAWFTFGTLAGYGADFHARTAAGRLLSVGLYILSIILIASCTANLASDLTLAKSQNIITGLDDIKNGKIPYNRIGIVVGGAIEQYYLQEISSSQTFYPLQSQSQIFSALLNNVIDASIADTAILQYATSSVYCNLTLVGANFNPNSYGIVVRKEWLYTQALDVSILSIRESGTLNELQTKWFEGNICPDSSATDTSTAFTIESLCGLFGIFGIISILSLLLFVWLQRLTIKDYLWKRVHRKDLFVKKNNSTGVPPVENSHELSQIRRSNSVSSIAIRL